MHKTNVVETKTNVVPTVVKETKVVQTYKDVPLHTAKVQTKELAPLTIAKTTYDNTYQDAYHSPKNYFTNRDTIQK